MARPLWKYRDSLGTEHTGHLETTMDDGRTYAFRDATTGQYTVVSGALLKEHAHRIWETIAS